jgi:preprotein translocase subunit SecG
MENIILAIHLIIALVLIGAILLQRSEGGALGIGGSGVFNSSGKLIGNPC